MSSRTAMTPWRPCSNGASSVEQRWNETPMALFENDRWRGAFTIYEASVHEYTVEAWIDTFGAWRHEFATKFAAGIPDLTSESLEGAALLEVASQRAHDPADVARLAELGGIMRSSEPAQVNALAQSGELEVLMATYPDRSTATQYAPAPRVTVDRVEARTAAWSEFFPTVCGRFGRSRLDSARGASPNRRRQGDGI